MPAIVAVAKRFAASTVAVFAKRATPHVEESATRSCFVRRSIIRQLRMLLTEPREALE